MMDMTPHDLSGSYTSFGVMYVSIYVCMYYTSFAGRVRVRFTCSRTRVKGRLGLGVVYEH